MRTSAAARFFHVKRRARRQSRPSFFLVTAIMPEIQAFRGLRYDLGHVGSLSDVVAPPYDVIGPELQSRSTSGTRPT